MAEELHRSLSAFPGTGFYTSQEGPVGYDHGDGGLLAVGKNAKSYRFSALSGFLHLVFYRPDVVRFCYSAPGESVLPPPATPAIVAEPGPVETIRSGNVVKSAALSVTVCPRTLTVEIRNARGELLSSDSRVDPVLPGLAKKLLWEEGIYGSGEKYAWLNHLGLRTAHYNSDVLRHSDIHHPQVEAMHTAVPFYIAFAPGRAYGIFFDNSHGSEFSFAAGGSKEIAFRAAGGGLDYYFMAGPEMAGVLGHYTELTGRAPLLPRKVLGYHQSRYSYGSREELLTVARSLREHNLPADVLHLDIDYMDGYRVFTVDGERFSDFAEMISILHHLGFALVPIIDPGVKVEEGFAPYDQGLAEDYFLRRPGGEVYEGEVWPGRAVFPDFLRAEVRRWWGGLHRPLVESGASGIWTDMNEPADFSQPGGAPPGECLHRDDHGRPVKHAAVHNLYGLLHSRATREALEELQPGRRPFVMTRATFAGGQRYATLWTGDNSSVWEHLESSIPMNLNLAMSGFPFTGADVGGYRGDCSPELLVRWTQLGALMPFFRNHSEKGAAPQEPWVHGEPYLAMIRSAINLRYRLITFIYNLLRESSLGGTPPIRPLAYHYQDDRTTYSINDQFLVGPDLLVCPVTRPGINYRSLYLPAGLWHDYWTGEVHRGGRHITREAPLDLLPLYVRAGAIIPHDSEGATTVQPPEEKGLMMACYTGKAGKYRLYLDDGFSLNYRHGHYSEVEFTMDDDPRRPRVEQKVLTAGYPLPGFSFRYHPLVK